MAEKKKVEFLGDSLEAIKNFPADAKRDAGYQIGKVQDGLMPDDFKAMRIVGKGVIEIRITDTDGAFRVFYVASRGDKVYILHGFQKKTQKTAKGDIEKGQQRYKLIP
ncbi:type II toxin-antitoxin system RelE/ParE family toxin [Vreelandella alkaliphila]|uniref:Type II toxin-antitoxin system RelE/ParE family toxin n=1 Tax=Vreelandella alkaliphila TaxID=272774 RepID=A0AAJ2RZW7_9GAMM|nr:type II toxin-antitoxin system RelE/ParE family toxin [Halomonas alkaliphila]MDX5979624.1 type II toxin-antitoxin system RelE/ParE family toxin [Halomonas alkaliphila]